MSQYARNKPRRTKLCIEDGDIYVLVLQNFSKIFTGWGKGFFSSLLQCPNQLCGPPSLLSNGCRGLFPWKQSGRDLKLTTPLHLVPRLRIRGIRPLPTPLSMVWCLITNMDGALPLPPLPARELKNIRYK
jgi:hypothetical protein